MSILLILFFSVAELYELVEAGEVAVVGYAFIDDVVCVAFGERDAIDTEEDEARVDEVLHEGDAYVVHAQGEKVARVVHVLDELKRRGIVFQTVGHPVFGDGGVEKG